MSISQTKAIDMMDKIADYHAEKGNPVIYNYNGHPFSEVVSTEPFEQVRFGVFKNRSPRIKGEVAIVGFTTMNEHWPAAVLRPDEESTQVSGLYVAGFSPYEYKRVVDTVLMHDLGEFIFSIQP